MEVTDFIELNRFTLWLELFKQYNGRFLATPHKGQKVYVRYTFDSSEDYLKFCQSFINLTTDVKVTKRGLFKKITKKLSRLNNSY